jgi:hypothetical protein
VAGLSSTFIVESLQPADDFEVSLLFESAWVPVSPVMESAAGLHAKLSSGDQLADQSWLGIGCAIKVRPNSLRDRLYEIESDEIRVLERP